DEADVLLGIEARGGAAGQQAAADLEDLERLHPGVAAGVVHHHVDAAVGAAAAPRRLAVELVDLVLEVVGDVVDRLVGTELHQPLGLGVGAGAGDHLGAGALGDLQAAQADPTRSAQDQYLHARAIGAVGGHL